MLMASNPGSTNGGTPSSGEPYTFPSFGNFGPPYVATLSLLGLTIGLPVWLFPTSVIPNPPNVSLAPNTLDVGTPPIHQPHVDFSPSSSIKSPSISPSSPSEISRASSQVDQEKKKWEEKKKKNPKRTKAPTTSDVGSNKPVTVNSTGSVDEVNKIKRKNPKPKFPCSLCKGDHFLRDCPGLTQVLEMWSSMSSASIGHVDGTPSTSDVQVGKKKQTVKFPCMLCKGNHYSHLCPRMDEASSLLEKHQLPKGYHKLSSDPSLVDGLVNPVPSLISPVDQVVNLVSSSIEPQTQVVDPFSSLVDPTLPLEGDTKVVDPVPPSINPIPPLRNAKVIDPVSSSISPTLPLKSAKVVDPVSPSVDPIPPLRNVKVTDPIPSSVSPTLPLKSAKVVDPVSPSVDPIPPLRNVKVIDLVPFAVSPTLPPKSAKGVAPVTSLVNPTLSLKRAKAVDSSPPLINPTPLLESKPDTTHVFLVNTDSTMPGGIPPSPKKLPPSNEAILFDWGALTGPRLPSHIPFQITVQVHGQYVPQTLIDEGASISILSYVAWYALGCSQLTPVTQNLLAFNRRTSQPLGILPQFPVTLGGKTVFIDVMVVRDPLDFTLLLGWDYVYAMKALVSTLFRVISFPHDGRIVTIDQLSFISPNWVTSLSGSYVQTVSPLPHVNYVALSPMTSTSDDLDLIVDMVISSVGLLEPDLLTPIVTLNMCTFSSDSLPSSEDLLEAMTDICPLTWYPSRALSSWKL
jgi:hypothetical protein